ncbi:GNAT family N-acetyltransferase [Arthrobacter sp. HLT1-20]
MNEPISYRARRSVDSPWLLALFTAASPGREYLPEEMLALQENLQRQQWGSRWGDGETIVVRDGAPVARIWVAWGASAVRIVDLSVDPGVRGEGLGWRIMSDLCDAADASGLTLELSVNTDNAAARHLYESLDFQPCSNAGDTSGLSLTLKRAAKEETTS